MRDTTLEQKIESQLYSLGVKNSGEAAECVMEVLKEETAADTVIAQKCAELAVQAPIDWQISCGNRKRFDIHDVRNFQKTTGKLIHDLIVEKFGVEKEKLLGDPILPKPKNEASDD